MKNKKHIAKWLRSIHSELDRALGDSDITHFENDEDLKDRAPVQWAAYELAKIIDAIDPKEAA